MSALSSHATGIKPYHCSKNIVLDKRILDEIINITVRIRDAPTKNVQDS